jgi:hypothetical protein
MAAENGILDLTFAVSGNGLSANSDQFIFAKMGNTSPQVVAAAAGDRILGITQSTAKKTEGLSIRLIGVSKLRLGGTVKAGNQVKADANGNGVLGVGNAKYGAQALEDGVSSDVISVLLEQTQAAT